MSRYKIYLSVWAFLCVILCSAECAEVRSSAYVAYIERWKATALDQQAKYGIPASITLAQGLLESGAGQSDLATLANNHFGIKCHSDWQGGTYHKDDDQRDECFRSYARAEDSFRDHSLFLKRKRYESLFAYKVTDYKAWAKGLKECGYATDPKYPQKLIQIIETYELDKVSRSSKPSKHDKPDQAAPPAKADKPTKTDKQVQADKPVKADKPTKEKPAKEKPTKADKKKKDKPAKEKPAKADKQTKDKPTRERAGKSDKSSSTDRPTAAPVVPVVPVAADSSETEPADTVQWKPTYLRTKSLHAEHASGRINGRRFVVAQDGDSWGSFAFQFGMEEKTLRRINEVAEGQQLHGGDKVYVFPKRRRADARHTSHQVQAGETAWFIAQYYGMRVSTLCQLNGITADTPLAEGNWLRLR